MTPTLAPELAAELDQLQGARERLIDECNAEGDGAAWCAEHTAVVDRAATLLFQGVLAAYPAAPRLALVATGGYGRRELAPFSDIDITVVPEEADSPVLDEALRALFRVLHQTLGADFKLEIGYAYRLISDVAGLDAVTRTGLLDMRPIAGSQRVYNALADAFWESMPSGEFVLAKITERNAAARRFNDSPLSIEPHLKEGAGGLRAYQASNWIRAAIGERAARPDHHYATLLRARNLLHKVSGRKQDQLTRPRQVTVCDEFGLVHDDFMRHVLDAMLHGSDEYELTLERLREARFQLSGPVMALRGEARVESPADPGEAAVGIAVATKLGLSVSRLDSAYLKTVSGPAAIYALSTGEATLRNLDKCGLIAELLPELSACRTLLPDDSSHAYTVFEHTLRVVGMLDRADADSFLGELKGGISDTEPLYLAALLHDVGKLRSSAEQRPHSEIGAELAREVGARWQLSERTIDLVAWLVREHLTMSLFMRIRDVQHPATIAEFAAIVTSPERLFMLALLTWADISSVADGAFTPAQYSFLRDLTNRTHEALQGGEPTLAEPSVARRRLLRQLVRQDVDEARVEAFLESLPAYYFTATSPELVRLHMAYADRAKDGHITVETNTQMDIGATEVTLCALDSAGLLSAVLGVMYAFDLSISGIRACTTETSPPIALDAFTVSFGGRPVPNGTWTQVATKLRTVLGGELDVEALLRSKGKDPDRRQHVLRYVFRDGNPEVLEIQAPRGRGMAYRLSRMLRAHGFNILSARVGQWGSHAAAAFYLQPTPDAKQRIDDALAGQA
ncbi:MAG: [protein-PII] uridylyltransferase family protein [Fimbriimonadaceae bacterium]